MTSPQLIVLPTEKGVIRYWISFISFRTMYQPNSMWMRKCRDHLQATQGLRYFHSSQLHWDRAYFSPTSFIKRILLIFRVSQAWPFILWGYLSSYGVITQAILLLELKNTSVARPGKKVSYPNPASRNYSDIWNLSGPQSNLVRRLEDRFRSLLWGFICAICISAQR